MIKVTGNVVIAGENIYAGIDDGPDDISKIPFAIVVKFANGDDFRAAMRAGAVEFTLFKLPQEPAAPAASKL